MEELAVYLMLGAFAGTLAGLLGVGGGLVIVPVLALVFHHQGVTPGVIMHLAIGTSLATIVFTSVSSVRAHHRRGAVLWPVFRRLTPGIVAGAALGALVADHLPSQGLQAIFGIFELLVAAQLALDTRPVPHRRLPGWPGMGLAGILIGAVSAVIGIGGGSMTVPFLAWCNVRVQQAVGTSAACGLPIAVAGALGFLGLGWDASGLPQGAYGYLYLPALGGVVLASVLFAPLGARLAHALPSHILKRFFAVFLALLGLRMLIG